MGCNCVKKTNVPKWEHTAPDGVKTVYMSSTEAEMAKARKGGNVRKVS